jgi:predicted phosphodiesterase
MEYIKQENESLKQYKIRLYKNKDLYDLTSQQIADLINKESGESYGESCYRKWFKAYAEGVYDTEKEFVSGDKILKEYELKRIEFEKEKIKFFDQRTAYTKDIRTDARLDELKEILINSIKNIKSYPNKNYTDIKYQDNDLLVGLNDLHFGIEINNYWNKYNPEIAKQRLEKYIQEIISIQKTHSSENCYICANGDLISGNSHLTIALANRENVVEQVMGVSELISWFISELSNYFKNVYFSVVAGNHSRLSLKENSPKNERLDDLIPFYIKARLQNLESIKVLDNNIDNTISLINIRGLSYLGVHGDMDKMDNILKLVEMLPNKAYAILFGHLHHNVSNSIQGYKLLMSGSLMGVDDFCIEKRILGKPQQLVCVCDNNGVRAIYDIIFD